MKARKKPHWMPTVVRSAVPASGRSKTRQNSRNAAQAPAAKMTVPSPPGRWKARCSARKNSSSRTPVETRKIAASMNDTSPKALMWSPTSLPSEMTLTSYHGRNMVSSSPRAASTARRCSASSALHARAMRTSPFRTVTTGTDSIGPPRRLCNHAGVPRRVRYADHADGFCDVYGDGGRRALVLHGGFWRDRYDLTLMDALCEDLAARGWEAWNAEYRRLGATGARWPEMAADVRAAAECAGAEVAIGHSAGGHLALWLAAEGLVDRAVGQAPVSDLAAAAGLSGDVVAELGADEDASPRARLPLGRPQLLVHGTLDDCVPVAMSRNYATAAGVEVTYMERDGEGHFEHIDPRSGAWADVLAWL